MLPAEDEKRAIDAWIEREGRDKYGGNSGTVYAGGNPLFDMKTGRSKGRYSFIVGRHPDRPWMIGGSSTASGGGGASGGSRDLSGSGASR